MAFYSHDKHDDIPFFSKIKTFDELVEDDEVYILHLQSLDITTAKVSDLEITDEEETVTDWTWEPSKIKSIPDALKSIMVPDTVAKVQTPHDTVYKYKKVEFVLPTVDDNIRVYIPFGTETNYIYRSTKVICTTKREAEQLANIIRCKCEIQMSQFKGIFHGAGWNYERKHFKCG